MIFISMYVILASSISLVKYHVQGVKLIAKFVLTRHGLRMVCENVPHALQLLCHTPDTSTHVTTRL